jgi:hypothetical protein
MEVGKSPINLPLIKRIYLKGLNICVIYLYGSTVLLLDFGRFLNFFILYSVGRTPWSGDQPVAKPLPTQRTTQTQNKGTQISIFQMGFEPTIPAFKPL